MSLFRNFFVTLSVSLASLVMPGCGNNETYKLTANIEGLGTQNVSLYFYTRSGLQSVSIPAIDGVLEYTGSSKEPVLIELITGNRRTVGYIMARNGETISAGYRLGDNSVTTVKGNKVSARLASFCADNAALIDSLRPAELNAAIEEYVTGHPSDLVSAILMSRLYDATLDPAHAGELLRSIDAASRPASVMAGMGEMINVLPDSTASLPELSLYCLDDTLRTFAPKDSLGLILAITAPGGELPHDSLAARLNAAYDTLSGRLILVEFMAASDTMQWRGQIDSVKPAYDYVWMPGGVASPAVMPLNIKSLPAVVGADSTGRIIYRGSSIDDAIRQFTSK